MRLSQQQIDRLRTLERDERLNPRAVVEDARDAQSSLHGLFEWEDAVAAEAHRLSQARAIIRTVNIAVTTNTYTIVAPRYVRDTTIGNAAGYVSTHSLTEHTDEARAVMAAELARVLGYVERVGAVARSLGFVDPLADVVGQVQSALSAYRGQPDDVAAIAAD